MNALYTRFILIITRGRLEQRPPSRLQYELQLTDARSLYHALLTLYLTVLIQLISLNSSLPGAAYMRWWTGSALVQVMVCYLFTAKPLPERMLTYCQLDTKEQMPLKFKSKFTKMHLKMSSRKWTLQWRHNGRDGVSNHQPLKCLLNHLFGRRLRKTSKLRVTGLCEGNSPGTGEFPAQMASNAGNFSIWWRHRVVIWPMGWGGGWVNSPYWPGLLHFHGGSHMIAPVLLK